MKASEQIEVKIPVPWSSEPIGVLFSGWRCIMLATIVTAVAAMILLT
jgi:hypothetical protein